MAATSIGPCGAKWTASTYESAPASRQSAHRAATSLTVPAPFDAQPNAATRVRSVSSAANASGSTTQTSGSIATWRTVTPRSSAASSHGATLASWSRPVTSTSSPGPSSRKSVREACIVSVVMFAPKTISPAWAPRNSAACARASSRISPGRDRGHERAAQVGVRIAVVAGDGVVDGLVHLGAAGVVEEGAAVAQRRKP